CAVTFAVAGLEDARIAAIACGELRSDFLKQLVGCLPPLDVTTGQPARVQGTGLRLGDELLDARTQLLRLRLGSLDRTMLDERLGEIAHERELLFGGAAKLAPGLA